MSKDTGFCSITEDICRKEGECETCSLKHIHENIEHYAKLHEQGRLIEVVRCKDCRHEQYCKQAQYLGADGYCSKAELKKLEEIDGESNRCVYCQDGKSLHGQKIIPTNYGWQTINYCPNCGAKMELKELEG